MNELTEEYLKTMNLEEGALSKKRCEEVYNLGIIDHFRDQILDLNERTVIHSDDELIILVKLFPRPEEIEPYKDEYIFIIKDKWFDLSVDIGNDDVVLSDDEEEMYETLEMYIKKNEEIDNSEMTDFEKTIFFSLIKKFFTKKIQRKYRPYKGFIILPAKAIVYYNGEELN